MASISKTDSISGLKYCLRPPIFIKKTTSIIKALDQVQKLCGFKDAKNDFFWQIISKTGLETAGELRLLSSEEWAEIEIPLVCRENLRAFIESYPFLSTLETLQAEFFGAEKIDLHRINGAIEHFVEMGFGRLEVLEALVVAGEENFDQALDYLSLKREDKAKIKKKKRLKSQKLSSPEDYMASKNFLLQKPVDRYDWRSNPLIRLEAMSLHLRGRLAAELKCTAELKNKVAQAKNEHAFGKYKAFLEGLLASGSLDFERQSSLEKFREENDVGEELHAKTLESLKMTRAGLEQMETIETEGDPSLCSICFERPKSHLIIGSSDCFHFCLCGHCAELVQKAPGSKCPVCCKPILTISEIFYE